MIRNVQVHQVLIFSISKCHNKIFFFQPRQMAKAPTCAGVIVFNPDHTKVVLLESEHKGNWSFPKGGREKSETPLDNALRELHEESGLTLPDITLLKKEDQFVYIDEINHKGFACIRYFVATCNKSEDQVTLKAMNPEEILYLSFCVLGKAMHVLKQSRKDVLSKAIALYKQ